MATSCTIKFNPNSVYLSFLDDNGAVTIELRGRERIYQQQLKVEAVHRPQRTHTRTSKIRYIPVTGTLYKLGKDGYFETVGCSASSVHRFLVWLKARAKAAVQNDEYRTSIYVVLSEVLDRCYVPR